MLGRRTNIIMRFLFFILFFLFCSAFAFCDGFPLKFSGNTDYTKQTTSSLITQIDTDYKIVLFEPRHKKWAYTLNGKVSTDYDHFGNEIKVNVFTAFGVDF